MGKSRRGDKERSREQELKHENQRLKRENGRLKKELARLDLDSFNQVKDAIEEHSDESNAEFGQAILEKMRKEWACNDPNCAGFLEIQTYTKASETWYYRLCSRAPACKNRTKGQKYTPDVKGPIRDNGESKI